MNTPYTMPDHIEDMHRHFVSAFEHLARTSVPSVRTEFPFITDHRLTELLIALGSTGTSHVQTYLEDLVPEHYTLTVQYSAGHDVWVNITDPSTGAVSSVALRLIWQELLFGGLDSRTLRPAIARLMRAHALTPLYRDDNEHLMRFSAVLSHALASPPHNAVLLRLAHMPVLMLNVIAENPTVSLVCGEREAHRRLDRLYGKQKDFDIHLSPRGSVRSSQNARQAP